MLLVASKRLVAQKGRHPQISLGRMPFKLPVQSEQSSRFFPPSYKPSDGPPVSVLDEAKQKILSITQGLPDPVGLHVRQEHLCLLTDSPGYAAFFLTSLDRHERLLKAKPVLVQGWSPPQLVPALREPNSKANLTYCASTSHTRMCLA